MSSRLGKPPKESANPSKRPVRVLRSAQSEPRESGEEELSMSPNKRATRSQTSTQAKTVRATVAVDSDSEEHEQVSQRVTRSRTGALPSQRQAQSTKPQAQVASTSQTGKSSTKSAQNSQANRSRRTPAPPSTQPGGSKQRRSSNSATQSDELREALLHYVLVKHSTQGNTVFSRRDLLREPLQGLRDQFANIFHLVNNILEKVFMMKLVPTELSQNNAVDKSDNFILIGTIPFETLSLEDEKDTISLSHKFLKVALEAIFMKGSPMEIDELWNMMTELEFHETLCPEFDQFAKFLKTEYVSKYYLNMREFVQAGNIQRNPTYEWGTRALHEFSKLRMLKSVAKLFGFCDLKVFMHAYTEARKHAELYGHPEEIRALEDLEATLPPGNHYVLNVDETAYASKLVQSLAETPRLEETASQVSTHRRVLRGNRQN